MNLAREIRQYIEGARIGHAMQRKAGMGEEEARELVHQAQEVVLEGIEAILAEHDKEEEQFIQDMAEYYENLERARENQE